MRSWIMPLALLASFGCSEPSNYYRDVQPILDANCVSCHRPAGAGPFALTSYEEAKRVGRQLVEVTQSGYMPPWRAAEGKHALLGARHLSADERSRLKRWFEEGMPAGIDASTAARLLPSFEKSWARGEPDLLLTLDQPFELPADGEDLIRNFVLPGSTRRDRWVLAVELRPGNPKVVHHAILKVDSTGYSRRLAELDPSPGFGGMEMGNAESPDGELVIWAPGTQPLPSGREVAWPLPAAADWVLQLHLVPSGKREQIAPQVAVYFTEQPPKERPLGMLLKNEQLDIPAGESNYMVEDSLRLPIDARLMALFPHAHYLGRAMTIWADLPNGEREELLSIPQWDFDWQEFYRFEQPVSLPAGSTLRFRYRYDNSDENVRNPNRPAQRVVGGNRSIDEMATLGVQIVAETAEGREQLQRAQFERLIEKGDRSAAVHYNLGVVFARQGQLEQAASHYQQALKLDPNDHFAHFGLGSVLARQRRFSDAERHYRRAVELQPEFADAQYFLGRVYLDLNRVEAARQQFERTLEIEPSHPRAQRALGELRARKSSP
jgi:tetratricopeptide (TPR) repeat protein